MASRAPQFSSQRDALEQGQLGGILEKAAVHLGHRDGFLQATQQGIGIQVIRQVVAAVVQQGDQGARQRALQQQIKQGLRRFSLQADGGQRIRAIIHQFVELPQRGMADAFGERASQLLQIKLERLFQSGNRLIGRQLGCFGGHGRS